MTYASGQTPKVGDRISGNRGKLGTVTIIKSYGCVILTVKWDDGIVGINYNYTAADRFTLISRAPE